MNPKIALIILGVLTILLGITVMVTPLLAVIVTWPPLLTGAIVLIAGLATLLGGIFL